MKPEAVVSGFSPQLEAHGGKQSRYCLVAGIAESVDSFIDSFGMSHVTRRHLCSTLGPIPSAGKAAKRESLCLSVSSVRACILYFTPLKGKYLKDGVIYFYTAYKAHWSKICDSGAIKVN